VIPEDKFLIPTAERNQNKDNQLDLIYLKDLIKRKKLKYKGRNGVKDKVVIIVEKVERKDI